VVKLSGKKYLVTGAAGFIGSHVAEELVKQGKEVIAMDNLVAGKLENLRFLPDTDQARFDKQDVCDLLDMEDVDTIFHLAASKCTVCRDDPQEDLMVNAWGSFRVFDLARKLGAKVVHVSTGSVNRGRPVSFYGVSKMAGEAYLRAFREYYEDFRYAALRIYHVYGPRQDSSDRGGVIPIFIRQAHENRPLTIHGDGDQVRHFTYVKDVVNALFFLADDRYNHHHFDFLNDEALSIFNLARKINQIMEKETHSFTFQDPKLGDIKKFYVKSSLDIPGTMTRLDDGLQETIDWYTDKFEKKELKAVV